MARDLTINLEDRPGELARLGETLGQSGINVDGMCAVTGSGEGVVHILVEDHNTARQALSEAGFDVSSVSDVLVVDQVDDRPGTLGELSRRFSDAGANLKLAYLATNTRLVFLADDLDKARSAL